MREDVRDEGMLEDGTKHLKKGASVAADTINNYIQSGPAGVSILCFFMGLATLGFGISGIVNFFRFFSEPVQYINYLKKNK